MQKIILGSVPPWLQVVLRSSKNKEKISLTLKSLVPVGVFVAMLFGINANTDALNDSIEIVANIVFMMGSAVSSMVALYGAIRKVLPKKSEGQ